MTSRGTARQGRYQARELLGRGGTADVYRGFDTRLGRPVAIKRLRPDLAPNPIFRARFRREAQAAAKLCNPSIVAVYDSGEERDETGSPSPFIVMELVEGCTLRDRLRSEGTVGPEHALQLTSAVLDALACSHAAGIVHRDIKPGNVLISQDGTVKVADFGIARMASDPSGTVTSAGTVLGTAHYISPEQGRGEPVDVRSDIYSVGCMLYELLVGRPPFTSDTLVGILYKHISEAPEPPSQANSEVPAEIDTIVLKALAKDPAERYQSACEMRAEIDDVLLAPQPASSSTPDPAPVSASSPASESLAEGEDSPMLLEEPTTVLLSRPAGRTVAVQESATDLSGSPLGRFPEPSPAHTGGSAASPRGDLSRTDIAESPAWPSAELAATEIGEPAVLGEFLTEEPTTTLRQHSAGRLVAAALVGVVALLLGVGVLGLTRAGQPPAAAAAAVNVPAVLGFRQAAAETTLRNAHLVPRFELVVGAADAPVGIAITQTPSAGTSAPSGSTVTVIITIRPSLAALVDPPRSQPTNVPYGKESSPDVLVADPVHRTGTTSHRPTRDSAATSSGSGSGTTSGGDAQKETKNPKDKGKHSKDD
jgi:serine/threonine protein kinase